MKKNLKKGEEQKGVSRRLILKRETILTLADPLLELAQGGGGHLLPTSSGSTETGC